MLRQLALDVLIEVHRAGPRSHVTPFLGTGLVLALVGATIAARLATSRTAAVLGGGAGSTLAIAVTVTLLRGGHGRGNLAGLGQCVLTVPVVVSADGLTNLLLFAPTAFLAVLAIGRPARVITSVAVISLLIEGLQAVYAVGVCDSSDALLNTLGASVAALAAAVVRSAVGQRRPFAVSGSDACPTSS